MSEHSTSNLPAGINYFFSSFSPKIVRTPPRILVTTPLLLSNIFVCNVPVGIKFLHAKFLNPSFSALVVKTARKPSLVLNNYTILHYFQFYVWMVFVSCWFIVWLIIIIIANVSRPISMSSGLIVASIICSTIGSTAFPSVCKSADLKVVSIAVVNASTAAAAVVVVT